jgi:hypothetical protein
VQTSTHGLTIGATEVRKEFVADHEEQAEREWASLALLAEHAPGLAPRPLRREDGETPVIVMERIPGEPLAPRPLTTLQTQALGASLRRLYDVPVEVVREAGIGPRRYGTAEHAQVMVEWLADDHDLGECLDPVLVGEAVEVARAYVAAPPVPASRLTALGIADLNPANVLWDGRTAWTTRRGSGWRPTARCGRRSGSRCSCRATAAGGATRAGRRRGRPGTSWLSSTSSNHDPDVPLSTRARRGSMGPRRRGPHVGRTGRDVPLQTLVVSYDPGPRRRQSPTTARLHFMALPARD